MPPPAATWLANRKNKSPSPHIVPMGTRMMAHKNDVIPGYTGYMEHMRQGTASLMGTYENCRKQASKYTGNLRYGQSFSAARAHSISPNAMYGTANPRMKTNSKNRSSIAWGDDRDIQFTTMNSMYYIPHGDLTQGSQEHDMSDMTSEERRKVYKTSLSRVGQQGASAVENAMKAKLGQRTGGGSGALRSAFKYFDRDGSGSIDLHEFFKVIEFMGLTFSEDQVIALFGLYDDDHAEGELDYNLFVERVMQGDGLVSQDASSLLVAHRNMRMGKAPSIKIGQDKLKVARLDVKRIFDRFDFDKSNTIDHKEMAAMLQMVGLTNMSPKSIQALINQLDTNNNGVIEFDEFWAWFQGSNETKDVMKNKY